MIQVSGLFDGMLGSLIYFEHLELMDSQKANLAEQCNSTLMLVNAANDDFTNICTQENEYK